MVDADRKPLALVYAEYLAELARTIDEDIRRRAKPVPDTRGWSME